VGTATLQANVRFDFPNVRFGNQWFYHSLKLTFKSNKCIFYHCALKIPTVPQLAALQGKKKNLTQPQGSQTMLILRHKYTQLHHLSVHLDYLSNTAKVSSGVLRPLSL
jgi:hypothetical protein